MRAPSKVCRHPAVSFRHGAAMLGLACVALVGCGSQYYEQRLAASSEMYRYYDKLDRQLRKPWKGGGVTLRVPKGFEEIPAPEVPKEEASDGSGGEPLPDPRQPDFLTGGIQLPGLEGAWRTEVSSGGETRPAYIYVLSNYNLWTVEGMGELAEKFHGAVWDQLVRGLNTPQLVQPTWPIVTIPEGSAYVPHWEFRFEKLQPTIHEVPYLVKIYLFSAGTKNENQGAILHVYPADAPRSLLDPLNLSLETLQFSGDKPKGASKTGGASESSEF